MHIFVGARVGLLSLTRASLLPRLSSSSVLREDCCQLKTRNYDLLINKSRAIAFGSLFDILICSFQLSPSHLYSCPLCALTICFLFLYSVQNSLAGLKHLLRGLRSTLCSILCGVQFSPRTAIATVKPNLTPTRGRTYSCEEDPGAAPIRNCHEERILLLFSVTKGGGAFFPY